MNVCMYVLYVHVCVYMYVAVCRSEGQKGRRGPTLTQKTQTHTHTHIHTQAGRHLYKAHIHGSIVRMRMVYSVCGYV
jgi:hypothetical protein